MRNLLLISFAFLLFSCAPKVKLTIQNAPKTKLDGEIKTLVLHEALIQDKSDFYKIKPYFVETLLNYLNQSESFQVYYFKKSEVIPEKIWNTVGVITGEIVSIQGELEGELAKKEQEKFEKKNGKGQVIYTKTKDKIVKEKWAQKEKVAFASFNIIKISERPDSTLSLLTKVHSNIAKKAAINKTIQISDANTPQIIAAKLAKEVAKHFVATKGEMEVYLWGANSELTALLKKGDSTSVKGKLAKTIRSEHKDSAQHHYWMGLAYEVGAKDYSDLLEAQSFYEKAMTLNEEEKIIHLALGRIEKKINTFSGE